MSVPVVPYAASLRWYGSWYASRMAGLTEEIAIAEANRLCGVAGKDFARTAVGRGDRAVLMGVAVEGGASRLKRRNGAVEARISLHGNWPHVHLGVLDALYGRFPYYPHVIPGLREILTAPPAMLRDLNMDIHTCISGFMQISLPPEQSYGVLLKRGEEVVAALDEDISVIDALMLCGPEINLVLLRYYTENNFRHLRP